MYDILNDFMVELKAQGFTITITKGYGGYEKVIWIHKKQPLAGSLNTSYFRRLAVESVFESEHALHEIRKIIAKFTTETEDYTTFLERAKKRIK